MAASHHDTFTIPEIPISSTTDQYPTADTNSARSSRSSFFRNRFSNASLLSLSSIRTLLPQYSVVDTSDSLSSPLTEVFTENPDSPSSSSCDSPSVIEPPRYSLLHSRQLTRRASTAAPPFKNDHEFRYSYPIRPKNPWATLHLYTRDAVPGIHSKPFHDQPRVPRFWSCDPITGSLQLDLDSPQNIQQISITLTGSIVLSAHSEGSLPFLSREFTIWEQSMGDPLLLQSDDTSNSNVVQKKKKKKKIDRLAAGQYNFSFSFPFPTHADPMKESPESISDRNVISPFHSHSIGTTTTISSSPSEKPQRGWGRRFSSASPSSSTSSQPSLGLEPSSVLPPTFLERGISPNVAYGISMNIVHGRFNSCSKIKTNIGYFPASEPLPASQKRRDAYEADALVPCPIEDPEGWFAFPTVTIHGVVKMGDDLLHTKVDCTLQISQPLSYGRGCHIPCFITIHSDSLEISHLLLPNSAKQPTVRLLRRVWHPMANLDDQEHLHSSIGWNRYAHTMGYMGVPTSDMNLVSHEVGRANWWIPSKEIVQGPNTRYLQGEIHLSPDLQASCGFQSFRIEYAVELLSFQTATFTPEVQSPLPGMLPNVIASNLVEITSFYRQDEPVPTAYSEPPEVYSKRRISLDTSSIF